MQLVQDNGNEDQRGTAPSIALSETPISDALRAKQSDSFTRKDCDDGLFAELKFSKFEAGVRVNILSWFANRLPAQRELEICDARIIVDVAPGAERAVWNLLAVDQRPLCERLVDLKKLAATLKLPHELKDGGLEDHIYKSIVAASVILTWSPNVVAGLDESELNTLADRIDKIERRFPACLVNLLAVSDTSAVEAVDYLAKDYVGGLSSGPHQFGDAQVGLIARAVVEDDLGGACRRALALLAHEYNRRSGPEKTALAFEIFERSRDSALLRKLLTASAHVDEPPESIERQFRRSFGLIDTECLADKLEVVSSKQVRRLIELDLIEEAAAASWALPNEESQEELSDGLGAAISKRFAERPMPLPDAIAAKVDFTNAAEELIKSHGMSVFVNNLENFKNLPARFAMAAVEAGFASNVLTELKSFKLHNGEFGKLAQAIAQRDGINQLVRHINEVPDSGVKALEENYGLLTFKRTIGAPSAAAYRVFWEAFVRGGAQAARLEALELVAFSRQVLTASSTSEEMRTNALYPAAVDLAYPDNSGVDFQFLESCSDRCADLELFEVDSRYDIDLTDGATMVLRPGLEIDQAVIKRMHGYIRRTVQLSEEFGAEPEKLLEKMCSELSGFQPDPVQEGGEAQALAGAILNTQPNSAQAKRVKHLICMSEAAADANFSRYTHASRTRIESAGNRAYAELREVREFVATRLLDRVTRVAEVAAPEDRLLKLRIIDAARSLFAEDLGLLDRELKKFSSQEGSGKNLPLAAYITKSAASACMRRVTGVCVAGDNPPDYAARVANMWDMENYLQLVLVDTEKMRCEGGVLMHYYEEQGKRILTAAINPCSTLLYKCDQRLLFKQIMTVLEKFSLDNDIDLICMSTNPEIRTNRSNGDFENAMLERAREVHEQFSLQSEESFSIDPQYFQKEFDVLWRRGA